MEKIKKQVTCKVYQLQGKSPHKTLDQAVQSRSFQNEIPDILYVKIARYFYGI
jgi:hypothetical protein